MGKGPMIKYLKILVLVCIAALGVLLGMIIGGGLLGRDRPGTGAQPGKADQVGTDTEDNGSGNERLPNQGIDTQTALTVAEEMGDAIEIVDADEYYEQNGQVLSVTEVEASQNVQTEKEVSDEFVARGFTQYPVVTRYAMDGTFFDEMEIDSDGREKHPKYMTYYVTENEELWTIISTNGVVIANPVSYNLQSALPVQAVVSETESIMGYDNYTGKFYNTVPDDSVLIVKVVDRIDNELLERLTLEEIDKL